MKHPHDLFLELQRIERELEEITKQLEERSTEPDMASLMSSAHWAKSARQCVAGAVTHTRFVARWLDRKAEMNADPEPIIRYPKENDTP